MTEKRTLQKTSSQFTGSCLIPFILFYNLLALVSFPLYYFYLYYRTILHETDYGKLGRNPFGKKKKKCCDQDCKWSKLANNCYGSFWPRHKVVFWFKFYFIYFDFFFFFFTFYNFFSASLVFSTSCSFSTSLVFCLVFLCFA